MDKSELIKLYLDASDEVKIFVVKILENSQQLPEPREQHFRTKNKNRGLVWALYRFRQEDRIP